MWKIECQSLTFLLKRLKAPNCKECKYFLSLKPNPIFIFDPNSDDAWWLYLLFCRLDTDYRILSDHCRMLSACLSDGMFPESSPKLKQVLRRTIKVAKNFIRNSPGDNFRPKVGPSGLRSHKTHFNGLILCCLLESHEWNGFILTKSTIFYY